MRIFSHHNMVHQKIASQKCLLKNLNKQGFRNGVLFMLALLEVVKHLLFWYILHCLQTKKNLVNIIVTKDIYIIFLWDNTFLQICVIFIKLDSDKFKLLCFLFKDFAPEQNLYLQYKHFCFRRMYRKFAICILMEFTQCLRCSEFSFFFSHSQTEFIGF